MPYPRYKVGKDPVPESNLAAAKEYRGRMAEKGLVKCSVQVLPQHREIIQRLARDLRIQAGVTMPKDLELASKEES